MSLVLGARLGLFEITGTLGAGGMGEVYRARDTRLQREVALKILPDTFAADPERLARFEREAQVLASLNHPHIAALYGIEEGPAEAGHYLRALVLELVEGETLADRIAHGPLPLDDALTIARQIAHALEAAHEQGVIHRDLKPANIKITPDGTVKVLDFGLAKSLAPARGSADVSQSPTITTPAMTLAGVILGTASYMSPEQAKGREADKRSDVWAFGCVLFEMITGARPFEGEDVSETLAGVLMREPDWTRLPQSLPASIRTLLRRCLERNRRTRMADVAGALLAMDEALVATGDGPETGGPHGHRARLRRVAFAGTAAGAVVGALVAGGGVWVAMRPAPVSDAVQFEVPAPPKSELFPVQPAFSISPDGRRLAFITGTGTTERLLWIRPFDSATAQRLPGAEGLSSLIWSPDGESIVFTSGNQIVGAGDGRLRKIGVRGGPAVTIAEFGVAGAWSPQGDILFRGRDGRLYRVSESGGDPQPVTELDKARREVAHQAALFLPDGRRFVFQAQSADASESALYLSSLDAPSRVKLLDGLSGARYANGQLLYQRDGTLMVQPFDQENGRLTGVAVPLIEGIAYNSTTGNGAFSVSDNGVLVYRAGAGMGSSVLTWVDGTGRSVGRVGMEGDYTAFRRPALSSDGRRLAVTRREGQGRSDVWIVDLDRDVPSRFTFDTADDESPVWTPDGSRIVFQSNRKGQMDLYQRGSGGVGSDEVLNESEGDKRPTGFSPDGRVLLFSRTVGGRSADTWALPMMENPKPFALVSTGFPAGNAVFSPNGRWFAYCEGDSAVGDQVYMQPYPPNGTRVRLSPQSGSSPQWSADGRTVFFTRADNHVMRVDVVAAGGVLRAGVAEELFLALGTFDHRAVLADSRRGRFLVPVPREQFTAAIDVILNWPALLMR